MARQQSASGEASTLRGQRVDQDTRKDRRLIKIDSAGVEVTVSYTRTRWRRSDWSDGPARSRTIIGLIYTSELLIGGVELTEYDVKPGTADDDLFFVLDGDTQIASDLAIALCSCWPGVAFQVGAYGSILLFHLAWMHPAHAHGALWAKAAHRIIEREFARHALLIAKAFPLEYEGQGSPERDALIAARQRAMARYYGKLFGLKPLPGWVGRRGWLYVIASRFEGTIKAPKRCRRPAWL